MKSAFFILLFLLLLPNLEAQQRKQKDQNLQLGIKAGPVYSSVTDLSKMLVSESYYTGYTFTNHSTWGFTGSFFLNYKFDESISAIQGEVSYARLGDKLHYADIKDFNYDVELKYEYLNLELFYKAYVYTGLHVGCGIRLGFNLTPGALYYTSNGEELFGPDIRIQQQMRDVIKGRTNFAPAVGIGYEFSNGLTLDARYYYGISDVIETEVNNFHFIENKNASRLLQITIGYVLPYTFPSKK